MKVVLVGCGMQGSILLEQALEELPVTRIAVVDTGKEIEKSVRRHLQSARVHVDDDESGADLAIIATPSHTHRQVAERFDCPLYVEKPVALTLEDLDWFDERGNYKVGFQCRFVDGVQAILAQDLSAIEMVKCWKVRSRPPSYYQGWHGKWATDGGVLTQQGIHCVDLVCLMTGFRAPKSVQMLGARRFHTIEAEDTAEVVIDYGDFEAQVTCTTAGPSSFSGLLVRDHWRGTFITEGFEFEELVSGEVSTPWDEQSIWHQETPHATMSMRIAHAAYASWYEGSPVPYGTEFPLLGRP